MRSLEKLIDAEPYARFSNSWVMPVQQPWEFDFINDDLVEQMAKTRKRKEISDRMRYREDRANGAVAIPYPE